MFAILTMQSGCVPELLHKPDLHLDFNFKLKIITT